MIFPDGLMRCEEFRGFDDGVKSSGKRDPTFLYGTGSEAANRFMIGVSTCKDIYPLEPSGMISLALPGAAFALTI